MAAGGKGFTYQFFDSNGSWVVPAGVTQVFLIGCGGGAGGHGGAKGFLNSLPFGGPGSPPTLKKIAVVPNTTYNITIGAGGAGAAGRTSNGQATAGSPGGMSSFGSLASFEGASARVQTATGTSYTSTAPVTMPTVVEGAYWFSNGPFNYSGQSGISINPTAPYGQDVYMGGGGGGSGYGSQTSTGGSQGGNGSPAALSTNGLNGSNASSTNYGAGGGGGGSTNTGTKAGDGGNGAGGFICVIWVET